MAFETRRTHEKDLFMTTTQNICIGIGIMYGLYDKFQIGAKKYGYVDVPTQD